MRTTNRGRSARITCLAVPAALGLLGLGLATAPNASAATGTGVVFTPPPLTSAGYSGDYQVNNGTSSDVNTTIKKTTADCVVSTINVFVPANNSNGGVIDNPAAQLVFSAPGQADQVYGSVPAKCSNPTPPPATHTKAYKVCVANEAKVNGVIRWLDKTFGLRIKPVDLNCERFDKK